VLYCSFEIVRYLCQNNRAVSFGSYGERELEMLAIRPTALQYVPWNANLFFADGLHLLWRSLFRHPMEKSGQTPYICYGDLVRHPILHLLRRSLVTQPTIVTEKSGKTSYICYGEVWSHSLHLLWSSLVRHPALLWRSGHTACICYGEVWWDILHLLWRSLVRQPTFVTKKSGKTSYICYGEVWSDILHLLWRLLGRSAFIMKSN
jgi:hypothetical protein